MNYRTKKAQTAFANGDMAEAIKWNILGGNEEAALKGYHILVHAYALNGGRHPDLWTPEEHVKLFIEKYGDRTETLLKFLVTNSPPQYKSLFETTLAAL